MRRGSLLVVVAMLIGIASPAARAQGKLTTQADPGPGQKVVRQSIHNDVSRPLRDLAVARPAMAPTDRIVSLSDPEGSLQRPIRSASNAIPGNEVATPPIVAPQAGAPRQKAAAGVSSSPATSVNFDGLSSADNAAAFGFRVFPPDTNGDVGPNHYVQSTNLLLRVFDKTGTPLIPPTKISTLFAGFGGACSSSDNGDPIVVFDQLANRWMITQFAIAAAPFLQCVAVSAGPDPTGSYFRYAFSFGSLLNDYGKFSVWPDGYYGSYHFFNAAGTAYVGQGVSAFDRAKMLVGLPATMVLFNMGTSVFGALPSDLDGYSLPPAGAPNIFTEPFDSAFGGGVDRLNLFEFDVDFVTPANSTFTLTSNIPLPSFDTNMCGFARNCIPQPGGGTAKLDSLPGRGMFRVSYRNLGTHQSWVGNFTVDTGGDHAAPFWYELRAPSAGGALSLHQSGAHSPDTDHRWMGSIAQDRAGNIALGYSVSSLATFPSIRYATREPGDALGTLQAEATLVAGTGIQTATTGFRWGDYSSMSVDPLDDCTFWYTQEYYTAASQATSSIGWLTRVGAFKVPSCTSITRTSSDLAVSIASPASGTVGTPLSYTVSLLNNGPAAATEVSLTDVLPAGLSPISAAPSQGTCGNVRPVACRFGSIASGSTVTVAVTVTPTAAGMLSHTATSSQIASADDPTSANNSATSTINVSIGSTTATTYTTGPISTTITDLGTILVPIVVPDAGAIIDVNATVRLNHTFDSDLVLTLIHPDGTRIILANRRGGGGDNYGSGANDCTGTPTTFDDEAATAISAGTAPFAGSFRPDGSLGAVDGKSRLGTWQLEVADQVAIDAGTVFCATLVIESPTVVTGVNLGVSQTAAPNPASARSPLVYTVSVANSGGSPATAVSLTDTPPLGATFGSVVPSQGTCGALSGGAVVCALGTINAGANATLVVTVTPQSVGTATNLAVVTLAETDTDPTNNTSSLGVSVLDANLGLTLTDLADPVAAGDVIRYQAAIKNFGPGTSRSVVLTQVLAPGTTFVSGSFSAPGCTAVGLTVTCVVDSIDSGITARFEVAVMVDPTLPAGLVTSTATVSALTPDPVPGNNADAESTTIIIVADMGVVSLLGPSVIPRFTQSTYSLVFRNFGPSVVGSFTITFASSGAFEVVGTSGILCGNRIGLNTVTCTVTRVLLPSAGPQVVGLTIIPVSPGLRTIRATVSAPVTDLVPGNNFVNRSVAVS